MVWLRSGQKVMHFLTPHTRNLTIAVFLPTSITGHNTKLLEVVSPVAVPSDPLLSHIRFEESKPAMEALVVQGEVI